MSVHVNQNMLLPHHPAEFSSRPQKRIGTDTVLIIIYIYIYPSVSEILTLIYMPAKLMTYLKFPEMALIWQSSRQDSTLCETPCLADRIGGLCLKLLEKGISPQ